MFNFDLTVNSIVVELKFFLLKLMTGSEELGKLFLGPVTT